MHMHMWGKCLCRYLHTIGGGGGGAVCMCKCMYDVCWVHVHFWEARKIFWYVCMCICLCIHASTDVCVLCHCRLSMCIYLWFFRLGSIGCPHACMIARLFFWHTQQRSDISFMTMMCGVSCLHSEQKVVYAAALSPVSSQASLYSIQTAYSTHVRLFIV